MESSFLTTDFRSSDPRSTCSRSRGAPDDRAPGSTTLCNLTNRPASWCVPSTVRCCSEHCSLPNGVERVRRPKHRSTYPGTAYFPRTSPRPRTVPFTVGSLGPEGYSDQARCCEKPSFGSSPALSAVDRSSAYSRTNDRTLCGRAQTDMSAPWRRHREYGERQLSLKGFDLRRAKAR